MKIREVEAKSIVVASKLRGADGPPCHSPGG
jgi:hypothetical protein